MGHFQEVFPIKASIFVEKTRETLSALLRFLVRLYAESIASTKHFSASTPLFRQLVKVQSSLLFGRSLKVVSRHSRLPLPQQEEQSKTVRLRSDDNRSGACDEERAKTAVEQRSDNDHRDVNVQDSRYKHHSPADDADDRGEYKAWQERYANLNVFTKLNG